MNRLALPIAGLLAGFIAGALCFQSSTPSARSGISPSGSPAQSPETDSPDPLRRAIAALELTKTANSLEALAAIGVELENLNPTQVAAFLDYVEKNRRSHYDRRLQTLMRWWVKRDPVAATAWIRPRLERWVQDGPLSMTFEITDGHIADEWARALPDEALAFARQYPHSELAASLLRILNYSGPEKDPARRHALWRDFPEGRARSKVLLRNLSNWADKQPAEAFAAAQALPAGALRDESINGILTKWSEKDAEAAFEQYRLLGISDTTLLTKILGQIGAKDPAQAIAHLEKLDQNQMASAAPAIVDAWALRDPAAAFKWALDHGVSLTPRYGTMYSTTEHSGFSRISTTRGGGRSIAPLANAMTTNPDATLAWIRSLPNAQDRERFTELAMRSAKPELRMSLFNELPPAAQARSIYSAISTFGESSAAARQWAETLPTGRVRAAAWYHMGIHAAEPLDMPPGPDRDAMLHGRVMGIGVRIAEKSLDLTLQISDPVRRRDAFDDAMEYYTGSGFNQGDNARVWMEKADLPDEWKRPWRTSNTVSPPKLNQ